MSTVARNVGKHGSTEARKHGSKEAMEIDEDAADGEDPLRVVVNCRVFESAITLCNSSINSITEPNPVCIHS
jgi:hypothetical protein